MQLMHVSMQITHTWSCSLHHACCWHTTSLASYVNGNPPILQARQPSDCQPIRPARVEGGLAAQAARIRSPEKKKADALASVSGFAFHIQDAIRNTPAEAVSRSRIVDRYAVALAMG